MFSKHRVYKHNNMVDVAFLVTDVNNSPHDGGHDELYVRGIWLRNTGMGNNLHQVCADTLTVKTNDLDNWYVLNNEEESA